MLSPVVLTLAIVFVVAEPLPVRVVAPDGSPVAGAKVWPIVAGDSTDSRPVPEPRAALTDAAGKATLGFPRGSEGALVFARDEAGRVGSERGYGRQAVTVKLAAVGPREVRVIAGGKPVAGAVVSPRGAVPPPIKSARGDEYQADLQFPRWEPKAVTGPDGRATLTLPVGYGAYYEVRAAGHEPCQFLTSPGADLKPVLRATGAVQFAIAGVGAANVRGSAWNLRTISNPDGKPETRALALESGTFDGTAGQVVRKLPPGRYEFAVYEQGLADSVFDKADAIEVKSGETATLTAHFKPATTVTGKVIDTSGKGVAVVRLPIYVHDKSDLGRVDHVLETTTRPDGTFTVHGPPGWYRVQFNPVPSGYAEPPRDRHRDPQAVKVELGTPQVLPTVTLLRAVEFRAKLVLDDGKPAAGAKQTMFDQTASKAPVADAKGQLVLRDLPPDDAVGIRVKLGKAVNVPEVFVLDKTPGEVTIRLSESNAAGLTGRALDLSGKPIAGATARVVLSIPATGREEGMSMPRGVASATTGPDGRFTVGGLWPTDVYTVEVTANGFAKAEFNSGATVAGQTADLGERKLARAGLTVAGVVRDSAGKPVAGAEVFAVDGPKRMSVQSAADGSFKLTGFYDVPAWVFATKPGHRLSAQPVTPGDAKPATVTLRTADAPPAAPPVLTAAYKASLDKLTRHLLTTIWERKEGFHTNAMADMARYDLATAKTWRDAALAQGGLGYPGMVALAERRQTHPQLALTDINEVMAQLQALKGDAHAEAHDLARGLLATDKAAAARVVEEVAVRARKHAPEWKPSELAEAGEIALLAGNVAGGKRLLAEAADLVDKLDATGSTRSSYSVGAVASRLAAVDWPRAEALLKRLTDASEAARWRAATCTHLAASDPEKAIRLLDTLQPMNSSYQDNARIAVASAIAKSDPGRAEKLVAGIGPVGYRFAGIMALAELADKPRAIRLIDKAFALLETEPREFETWSNFGGASGFAAVGCVYAARVGHPELAELVNWTLSLRPPGAEFYNVVNRERSVAGLVAALALVDPSAARRVLSGVAPPGQFAERAAGNRDVLFALALADPDTAIRVVDQLMERAKKPVKDGGDGLSETGLVELGTVLTTPDRLEALSLYGNLPPVARERRD